MVLRGTFHSVSCSPSWQFPAPLPRFADFRGPPLTWDLARQSSSDVANAPALETFCVSFTFLASTSVAAFALGLRKDSLAVLDLQAVQLSVLTFHDSSLPASLSPTSLFKFPTAIGAGPRARVLITVTICARTCSKCGNRCCRAVDSFCQEHRRSHILGQLVSGALLMSLFQVFSCLKSVRQVFQLKTFCRGKDLPAVV